MCNKTGKYFNTKFRVHRGLKKLRVKLKKQLQCNLDLATLNFVTTCDLVTIFQTPFFNLQHKIIRFSDIMRFCTVQSRFSDTFGLRKTKSHNVTQSNDFM